MIYSLIFVSTKLKHVLLLAQNVSNRLLVWPQKIRSLERRRELMALADAISTENTLFKIPHFINMLFAAHALELFFNLIDLTLFGPD